MRDPEALPVVMTRQELREFGESVGHRVGQTHRRRVAVQAGIFSFVAAVVVSIAVAWALTEEERSAAAANTRRNCRVQASARPQGNARAFDQIAFLALLEDALHPKATETPQQRSQTRAFVRAELRHINALARRWRPYAPHELPQKITGFRQLASTIHPVPLVDCRKTVRG